MTRSSEGSADYAFVTGNGRSGTNWLLELLDLSPQTFCRSEPSGIETSPLKALDDDRFVKRADQSALDSKWAINLLCEALTPFARYRAVSTQSSITTRWSIDPG